MSISDSKFAIQKCNFKPVPAKIFGYMLLCNKVKEKLASNVPVVQKADLPLISEIIDKFTPEGVVHARLSFLQY